MRGPVQEVQLLDSLLNPNIFQGPGRGLFLTPSALLPRPDPIVGIISVELFSLGEILYSHYFRLGAAQDVFCVGHSVKLFYKMSNQLTSS